MRDGDASPLFHCGVDFASCFIPVIGERDVTIGKIPNAHVNADDAVMPPPPSHCCCCFCFAILTSGAGYEFGSGKIGADACAQVRFRAGRVYANQSCNCFESRGFADAEPGEIIRSHPSLACLFVQLYIDDLLIELLRALISANAKRSS